MSRAGAALARAVIQAAQRTPWRGAGGYSAQAFAARGDARPFPQADAERDTFDDFFRLFPTFDIAGMMRGKDVLDLGSGYGGKTVDYRRRCGAARVCGVEPHANMIEKSRRYAAAQGVDGVEFTLCGPRDIPYPSDSFDVVLTHDVLEHVDDPRVTVAEIHRVLRPGGWSFHIFPLYWGAFSHHLDYIVNIPGIHWMFSPRTLVTAANDVLRTHPGFGTSQQPMPRRSFDGRRDVLPGLNGLSGAHLRTLFSQFDVVNIRRVGLGLRGLGFVANSGLPVLVRDLVTATVVCVIRKPQ